MSEHDARTELFGLIIGRTARGGRMTPAEVSAYQAKVRALRAERERLIRREP